MRIIIALTALSVLITLALVTGCGAKPAVKPQIPASRSVTSGQPVAGTPPAGNVVSNSNNYAAPPPPATAPATDTSPVAQGMYRVTSEKGYSIDIIGDWKEVKTNSHMIDKAFMRPRAYDDTSFCENINIATESLPNAMSASEYAALYVKRFAKKMNWTVVSSTPFNGMNTGNKLILTCNSHDMDMKTTSIVFTNNTTGYMVTCSATAATYAQYESKFDQMARTLRIQ